MGREAGVLCWGKLSCSPDPGAICWGWCRFHLVYTSMQWPELLLYTALKHNNPLCYLSSLSHPFPSSPGPQALNPTLISLSLKPSPLFKCLPSTPFLSSLSICLSSSAFSPPLLPSTDHIPWVCAQPLGWWGGGYRCQCFDPMKADIQNRAADPATGHPGIWTTRLCVKPWIRKSRQVELDWYRAHHTAPGR